MGKNTEISERISEMLEKLGSNPNNFAKSLEYKRSQTIYDIINGKSAPSYDFFKRFQYSEYSEIINLNWLLTGRGEMLINSNATDKNPHLIPYLNPHLSSNNGNMVSDCIGNNENQSPRTDKTEDCFPSLPNSIDLVPFYNLPVTAGALGVLESSQQHSASPDGYVRLETFNGCEKILPVVGVSMEPIIQSGDYIGIKSIDCVCRSWDFIQTGVIYLIVTREDRMIKYIEKADDEEFIVCSSPNYHTFKVHKSDILEIHRVKAVSRGL